MAMNKVLGLLGLCRKAGKICIGEDPSGDAVKDGIARIILTASDCAENTVKRGDTYALKAKVPHLRLNATKEELGFALGRGSCAICVILDAGFTAAIAEKLSEVNPTKREEIGKLIEKAEKIAKRRGKKKVKKTEEQPPRTGERPRHTSFANQEKPQRGNDRAFEDKPRRSYGDKPRYDGERKFGDKPRYDKPRGNYGDKPKFDGERKFGDKPRYDKPRGNYGDKPKFDGERKYDGERKFTGERKFGDKPRYDKPRGNYGDKPKFDKPRYEGKPRGENQGNSYSDKPKFNKYNKK